MFKYTVYNSCLFPASEINCSTRNKCSQSIKLQVFFPPFRRCETQREKIKTGGVFYEEAYAPMQLFSCGVSVTVTF